MKTIYKYPLIHSKVNLVKMHKGAQVLTAQVQNGKACIWVLADTSKPLEDKEVEVVATGETLDNENGYTRIYRGTVQLHDGALVFHIFERVK
jgi:hypothetical protein